MKKGKFNTVILLFCVVVLSSWVISVAVAGKPPGKGKPSFTSLSYPGYVMFRDSSQDVIRSDGGGVYTDCGILGGTDMVEVNVWDDGTFRYVNFYPGVMYYPFYKCVLGTFSPRRVQFHFNVSGIPTSQLEPAGDQSGNAVREILRWYKGTNGVYPERSTTNKGFIDDYSLHGPIRVYRTGHSQIQFAIDPAPELDDPKAVTQDSVNGYYTDDDNINYWRTIGSDYEHKPYVIYNIEYGKKGFEVQPVGDEGPDGKPVTWIIRTKTRKGNSPVRLYVIKDDYYGEKVYLTDYPDLPFEFAVSLNPLDSYPSASTAPPKDSNISTTWGRIKVAENR